MASARTEDDLETGSNSETRTIQKLAGSQPAPSSFQILVSESVKGCEYV